MTDHLACILALYLNEPTEALILTTGHISSTSCLVKTFPVVPSAGYHKCVVSLSLAGWLTSVHTHVYCMDFVYAYSAPFFFFCRGLFAEWFEWQSADSAAICECVCCVWRNCVVFVASLGANVAGCSICYVQSSFALRCVDNSTALFTCLCLELYQEVVAVGLSHGFLVGLFYLILSFWWMASCVGIA